MSEKADRGNGSVPHGQGRWFLGAVPRGADLVTFLEDFCRTSSVQQGILNVVGCVSLATLGTYDQQQQVYVTESASGPLEIACCTGNASLSGGKTLVHLHAVLADDQGRISGGRLFPETTVFAAEFHLHEILGPTLDRRYDPATGLMLWAP